MGIIAGGLRDLARMLKDGARVFWQHWPLMLAVYFLGAAAHGGFLWLAVWASQAHPMLGMVFLPFASISLLIAMVMMMRIAAPTLPALRESISGGGTKVQLRKDIVLAVQVLIPFLAVYTSQGWMKEDLRTYFYMATADEWMNQGFAANFDRMSLGTDAQVFTVVIVALVLRKVIAGFNLTSKHLSIAGLAGYLEALWLVTLASYFSSSLSQIRQWVMSRVLIQNLLDALDWIINTLGPIGALIQGTINQIAGILSSMGSLVIVPVAWIAVGATIYGSSLPSAKPLVTSEQMTKRIKTIPNPVRRAAAQFTEPVVSPLRNTTRAIGRIAVAGVIPMVMLCIIFAATSELRVLVSEGMRWIIGPQNSGFWTAFTPHINVIAQAVYTTVMVTLLAAAVNTIITSQRRRQAEEAERAELEAQQEAQEIAREIAREEGQLDTSGEATGEAQAQAPLETSGEAQPGT